MLVVVEVTVARQNLRVGRRIRTFVRYQQTTLRRPQLKVPIGVKIQVSVVGAVYIVGVVGVAFASAFVNSVPLCSSPFPSSSPPSPNVR